jgi:SAM-dependent methyltransferase
MSTPPASHPLPLTGERTLPGIWYENYWFARHLIAYRFAAERCAGRRVLDAGCGEGYGTALLAASGAEAVGAELVGDVVAHARSAYPDVAFWQADLCDLPAPDAAFDAVVSFQVIEHLPDVGRYLDETARVLRPGGEFLCATPNRLTFTPDSDVPVNPFHITEFSPAELADALATRFSPVVTYGVSHGPRIAAVEAERGRSFPDLVLAAPPEEWPGWLAELVADLTADDFVLHTDALDASLDLLAVVRR